MDNERIPQHTIDLRRPLTPPTQKKRSLLRGRIRPRPHPHSDLHRVKVVIAWASVRREMLKYALALFVVLVPLGIAVGTWQIYKTLDQFSTHLRLGARATADGYAAVNSRQVATAVTKFTIASTHFAAAQTTISNIQRNTGGAINHVPWLGDRVLAAGSVTDAAHRLAIASLDIGNNLPENGKWDSFSVTNDGVISGSFGALQPLARHPYTLDQTAAAILSAYGDLRSIPPRLIPSQYRDQLDPIVEIIPTLLGSPDQAKNLVTLLRDILGTPDEREYLVLFQNDDEARPTGGFPGTYLLIKFDHGTFTITDAPGNGPYALRDHVGKGMLPPEPILSIAPYWTFQDATWFADVPTSASSVLDFYEQARGFRPDGVLFLTPHLMERLLTITGPLTLTDKEKTEVTATSFVRLVEEEVELKYDKSLNAPKSVLINVVPELLNRLLHLEPAKGILALTTFVDEFQRGNMSLVSEVPIVAKALTELQWSGALGTDTAHTLSIIRTNLGGGKTDRSITETDTVRYEPSGNEWKVTVTIDREHFGDPKDKLHGPANRSFMRVYTDTRARLLSLQGATDPTGFLKEPAQGAEASEVVEKVEGQVLTDPQTGLRISHESGYNVFGFWSRVEAGKQQTIVLQYAVPRDSQTDWKLWLRKQPGETQVKWRVEVVDSALQPVSGATGWSHKEGAWKWSGLSTYHETLQLKKG